MHEKEYKRTRVVELEVRVGGKNGGEEADRGLVGLPVRHGGGTDVELADMKGVRCMLEELMSAVRMVKDVEYEAGWGWASLVERDDSG